MGNLNSMVFVEYVLKSRREGLDQGCPTFYSSGPHLLNGISFGAATNNSN